VLRLKVQQNAAQGHQLEHNASRLRIRSAVWVPKSTFEEGKMAVVIWPLCP
jgi:hypothetical protein